MTFIVKGRKLKNNPQIILSACLVGLLSSGSLLAGGGGSSPPAQTPLQIYKNSWEHRAIKIQRSLDKNAPIKHASVLSTHNSYNSAAYANAVSYLDPNQKHSIFDQLEMDVRELELDVHNYFNMDGWPWEWGNELLLCHGQSNDLGCSSYDRHLSEGLSEINSWIRRSENSNELLFIRFESYFDGKYNDAYNLVNSYFGDLVYRSNAGCSALSENISKASILNSGKQIVIIGAECVSNNWGNLTFRGIGNQNGYREANVRDWTNYSDCGSSKFSRSVYDSRFVRWYGDETNLTAVFGGGYAPVTAANVREMNKCGVNMISLDNIVPNEARLNSYVWSWNGGEPNDYNGNEDCAMHYSSGRWNDANCNNSYRVACSNGYASWRVTNGSTNWTSAQNLCRSEFGSSYNFKAPVNGYENQRLTEAKQSAGAGNVWIAAHDRNSEGNWEAN